MSQSGKLYELQTLDRQLDTIQERLEEIEIILNENAAIQAAHASLAKSNESREQWRKKQHQIEEEQDKLRRESQASHDRLYSGSVHNPRELTDLQDKITELNNRIAELEDPLLEAMLNIEDNEEQIATTQASLDALLKEQEETLGTLTQERTQLIAKRGGFENQAEKAKRGIPAETLTQYQQIRKKLRGIAVAELQGKSCGVCASSLTANIIQQARRGNIVTCTTCGRILHNK